uniref:Uncharacterized protein n=1 Tax=Leersia perrieri TaxID=77586 RepID=A0A0D9W3T6_9ORYZ
MPNPSLHRRHFAVGRHHPPFGWSLGDIRPPELKNFATPPLPFTRTVAGLGLPLRWLVFAYGLQAEGETGERISSYLKTGRMEGVNRK